LARPGGSPSRAGIGQAVLLRRVGEAPARSAQGGRQGGGHDVARRMLVVLPAPAQEVEQAVVEQRPAIVQDAPDRLQTGTRQRTFGRGFDDHTDQPARPEGHQHAATGHGRSAVRSRQIVEQLRQGDRQGDPQDIRGVHVGLILAAAAMNRVCVRNAVAPAAFAIFSASHPTQEERPDEHDE
jgi:hypothetical protein